MAITAADLQIKLSVDGAARAKSDLADIGGAVDNAGKRGNFMFNALSTAAGFVGAKIFTGLTTRLFDMGTGFVMANANAEAFANQLVVATGDADKASRIFENMKQFAKDTPFEFPELIQGAANLEALGQSAELWMPIIGDTAAATNKSIDQTVQAVLDAQTGEFERLKEFGIKTRTEGDKIVFSFMKNGQMMEVVADNTAEGISNALMGIWDDKYDGAMATMSKTFMGQLATLRDNVSMLMQDVTKPIFEGLKAAMGAANAFFAMLGEGANPLEAALTALHTALYEAFGRKTATQIMGVVRGIVSGFQRLASVARTVAGVLRNALGKAFDVLIDNLDTVIAAAKGIGVVLAAFTAWGAITAIVSGLAAALALLFSPIALLIAGAALLGIAWDRNFLGMRDAVSGFLGTFDHLVEAFQYFHSIGLNPVQAGLRALGIMFPAITGLTNSLQIGVGRITEMFKAFRDTLSSDGLGAALQGLISDLAGLAGHLWDWTLDVAAPKITGWLSTAAQATWTALKSAANWSGDVAGKILTWTLNVAAPTVSGWLDDVVGWFQDQLPDDWGAFGISVRDKVIAALSGAFTGGKQLGGALGGLLEIGSELLAQLTTSIEGVDWDTLGQNVGKWLVDAVIIGLSGLGSLMALGPIFISGLAAALLDADWASIASSIGGFIVEAFGAYQDFSAGLVTGLAAGFMDAVAQVSWTSVASSISAKLANAISGAKDWATRVGKSLFSEFKQAVANVDWPAVASDVATKLASGISRASGFAVTVGRTLFQEFKEAVANVDWPGVASYIKDKLVAGISNLVGFAASIGSTLGSEFQQALATVNWGSVGTTIKNKLVEAVVGVGQAIWDAIWGEITGSAGDADWSLAPDESLPDYVPVEPVGEPASGLRNPLAGLSKGLKAPDISGLFAGMKAAASKELEAVKGIVSSGMSALTATISNGAATATTAYSSLMAQIGPATQKPMMAAQQAVSSGMSQIIARVANGMATVVSVTTSLMGAARGAVVSGMAAIVAAGNSGMASYRNAVQSGMSAAVGAVRSGISAMVGAASTGRGAMASAGASIGAALGQGIAAGIRGMIGAVAAASAAIVSSAINAAKAAGAIASPSQVMRDDVGRMLGLGAVLGVEDLIPRMDAAMQRLVTIPAIDPYGGRLATGSAYGGLAAGGNVTHITIERVVVDLQGAKELLEFGEFAENLERSNEIVMGRGR